MIECNFNVKGDIIGLSSEIGNLNSDTIILDDGTSHKLHDGSTFLAVDTGNVYILYKTNWYKL